MTAHTKETFAAMLDGRQMGNEITRDEERAAKELGLVVIFGYSDDNAEFRGAISDEIGCYNGGLFWLHSKGFLPSERSIDCDACLERLRNDKTKCATLEAVWDGQLGYSWHYVTRIPHAMFDVLEGTEKFCRGIVIDSKDLPKL